MTDSSARPALTVIRHVVRPLWHPSDEGVVVCIAPGPSLTYTDCRLVENAALRGVPVSSIAINDAYRVAMTAGTRYSPDATWWAGQSWISPTRGFPGHMYTLGNVDVPAGVLGLGYSSTSVLSDDPDVLATGGHGGYSAANLAFLQGPMTIALLGYDMAPDPASGQHHVGGDAPGQKHARYEKWLGRYKALHDALADRGVQLVNCSRRSAISPDDVPALALEKLLGL
mgnify:CR=1 FL=1